ncbi:MAG TPA: acetylornithine deacetylase [Saprospiraceae bacterium]|nr:acetylornithine deacetylase [Saprospiraceae bacterium]HMU03014.1 acetylornithine deacetylase [Saprospiraceae bacterium]
MLPIQSCIQILKDLVAFDVLGGQSNLAIMDYIIDYLNEYKVEYHLVPSEDLTKTSLHCRIGPAVDGGVILSGHTDVVPVEGQNWVTNPFELVEKDGLLYGRGSCDMKGFLACCLATVPLLVSADLKQPIYFAFSYDEEIGCLAGPALVNAIKKHYKEKPSFAIIGEPSMMQTVIGHKGICVLETTVIGSEGHSSRVKQEVSAVHVAAKLIMWLEAKMDRLVNRDDRFYPNHTSIHVGMINGGIAPNIIADKCSFQWDVRVIPQDSIEDVLKDFQIYCKDLEVELQQKFTHAKIVTKEHHPPVPPLSTEVDADLVKIVNNITGSQGVQTVAYAAEAGQFAQGGFSTIICGPGDIAQAHRANEYVAIDQLEKCLDMIKGLIQ